MVGGDRGRAERVVLVALAVTMVAILTFLADSFSSGSAVPELESSSAPAESAAPSTLAATSPPRRGAAAKKGPVGAPGRWKLDWKDEFSGSSVNLDRWRPNWLANSDTAITTPINDAELSCYDPANVSVRKGSLRLTAKQEPCRTHDGKTYDYSSAIVESAHDHQFTYGFAEARIYLPPSDGTQAPKGSCGPNWGVFFLNGQRHPEDGEIDVMECLSEDDVSWHYHDGTDAEPLAGSGYPEAWRGDMPGTSGWHTFGVDWQPDRLVFYYDGVVVGVQDVGVTDRPHYLIAALAVSGKVVAAPQTMQIDYIRVWKRAGSTDASVTDR